VNELAPSKIELLVGNLRRFDIRSFSQEHMVIIGLRAEG
jgi:hypothetical protein